MFSIASQNSGGPSDRSKKIISIFNDSLEHAQQTVPLAVEMIRKYVSTLDRTTQIVYYHYLMDYSDHVTKVVTRTNQTQLDAIMESIVPTFEAFQLECSADSVDLARVERDFGYFINTGIDDDSLATLLSEDLCTAKIARFFAKNLGKCTMHVTG